MTTMSPKRISILSFTQPSTAHTVGGLFLSEKNHKKIVSRIKNKTKTFTLSSKSIREAVAKLKRIDKRTKTSYYTLPIKNWPLFYAYLAEGKIRRIEPNVWELIDA